MKPTYNKIKNNFVRTPREITEALLKMEDFEGKILEPCCGDGAISEILKENGFEVESSDLFDYDYGQIKDLFDIKEEQDNIITNPPFSLKVDMIEKLLSVTKKKLVLLWYVKNIGNLLEGRRHKNLKTIYIFKKRIEWKETKIGWLFAWYVWEKGYEGDVTIKRIDWEQPIAQSKNSPTASAKAEDLICVKEDLLRKSPNSLTRTFLNANIICNFKNPLVSREQLNQKSGATR